MNNHNNQKNKLDINSNIGELNCRKVFLYYKSFIKRGLKN
jgi:hypothetical protein